MTNPNPAAPLTEAGRNLLVEVEAAAYRGGGISVARTHDAIRDIEIEARKSILDAARATSTPADEETRRSGFRSGFRSGLEVARATSTPAGLREALTPSERENGLRELLSSQYAPESGMAEAAREALTTIDTLRAALQGADR